MVRKILSSRMLLLPILILAACEDKRPFYQIKMEEEQSRTDRGRLAQCQAIDKKLVVASKRANKFLREGNKKKHFEQIRRAARLCSGFNTHKWGASYVGNATKPCAWFLKKESELDESSVRKIREKRKFCASATKVASRHLISQGSTAHKAGNYEKAFSYWNKAADIGNAVAQYNLGVAYWSGLGRKKDYRKATRWFGMAANQGDQKAQFALGLAYHRGQGVKQSDKDAAKWYGKAAAQGNAKAKAQLARVQREIQRGNQPVPILLSQADKAQKAGYHKKAVWYWRRAAAKGDAGSQYNLGEAYRTGRGIPKNFKEAAKWFRKAADKGNRRAMVALGAAYKVGRGVKQNDVVSAAWYRAAKKRGGADTNAKAVFKAGLARLERIAKGGLTRNDGSQAYAAGKYKKAVSLWRKAAAAGDARAHYHLGHAYRMGHGVPQNDKQAAIWYRKAARQGDADAKKELARLPAAGKPSAGAAKSTSGSATKPHAALNPGWLSDPKTNCSVWMPHRVAGETFSWSGQCRGGRAHGKGTLNSYINGKYVERTVGHLAEGKLRNGVYTNTDGERFEGTWRDGRRHGRGKLLWPNGDRFDGQWRGGEIRGRGKLVFANGFQFDGNFIRGQAHGLGLCRSPKGRTGKCEWRSGKFVRWVK